MFCSSKRKTQGGGLGGFAHVACGSGWWSPQRTDSRVAASVSAIDVPEYSWYADCKTQSSTVPAVSSTRNASGLMGQPHHGRKANHRYSRTQWCQCRCRASCPLSWRSPSKPALAVLGGVKMVLSAAPVDLLDAGTDLPGIGFLSIGVEGCDRGFESATLVDEVSFFLGVDFTRS